jgi:hypothetical protein
MKKIFFVFAVFSAIFLVGNAKDVKAQSMSWSGTVDDVVEISIRGRRATTRTLSGRTYRNDNYNFDGRMNRNSDRVRLDREDGRGKVSIVQRPNRRNNWTTIVRIEDKKGGADRYRFTLYWD